MPILLVSWTLVDSRTLSKMGCIALRRRNPLPVSFGNFISVPRCIIHSWPSLQTDDPATFTRINHLLSWVRGDSPEAFCCLPLFFVHSLACMSLFPLWIHAALDLHSQCFRTYSVDSSLGLFNQVLMAYSSSAEKVLCLATTGAGTKVSTTQHSRHEYITEI